MTATRPAEPNGRTPPHNLEAEQALLGAMLARKTAPDTVDQAANLIHPGDYYRPAHGHIHQAITEIWQRDEQADPITVAAQLDRNGLLQTVGGTPTLISLEANRLAASNAVAYARTVKEHAQARRIITVATEIAAAGYDHNHDQIAKLTDELTQLEQTTAINGHQPAPTVDQFLDTTDAEHDWLLPGLAGRGHRIIVTATEGGGKSTLLRQIGVQAAAGIHPFTLDVIDPVRVLLIDLENSANHLRRKLRPLTIKAGITLRTDHLRIVSRPEGANLIDSQDAEWLQQHIQLAEPELILIGPLYKLHDGDPIEEKPAKTVSRILDQIRARHNTAIILEAHTPYASGTGRRPTRPYGASLWSRWPELGIHLGDTGTLTHWRGAREDDHQWPGALTRGGPWPWTAVTSTRELVWSRITSELDQAGQQLSERALAAVLGEPKATIHRAIQAHRTEWETLTAPRDPAPEEH